MDIRLNKLISDSGICSRREADKYIEEGHVTVNGKQPHIGQRVNENDIVIFDDLQIKINKRTLEQSSTKKTDLEIEFDVPTQKVKKEKTQSTSKEKEDISKPKSKKGLRPGKYVKYNKYAAARHGFGYYHFGYVATFKRCDVCRYGCHHYGRAISLHYSDNLYTARHLLCFLSHQI